MPGRDGFGRGISENVRGVLHTSDYEMSGQPEAHNNSFVSNEGLSLRCVSFMAARSTVPRALCGFGGAVEQGQREEANK